MELRHLRYFVAVAEERHFGRAAARLHVTQSTLSAQVQGLEREVGGPLFARTSRRVELTEAGELLLPEARRVLAQAGRALHVARQSVTGEIGTVRIGFSGVAVLHGVLAADLHRFRAAHPRVEVTVAELPPTAQLQALRDGTLDIGYCPDLGLRPGDDLEMTLRARTTLSVALRHDHELATAGAVTTSRLAERDLIVFAAREEDETVLARLGPAATGHRARVQVVSGTLGVLALAAAGAGVAVVPAVTERIALPDLVYRPLLGADGPDVVSVSRAEELSGSVKAFVNCLSAPCRPRSEPG